MEGTKYRLIRLARNRPGSGQYLDAVMDRIGAMSRQFDGSGSVLVNCAWKMYAENSPYLGLWVAVDGYSDVVGHALGDIEVWNGRTVAWINQVKMDGPAGYALKEEFMHAVDQWIREANQQAQATKTSSPVTEALMMTPRMTDAWARHAGFEVYRTIYRRIVREVV